MKSIYEIVSKFKNGNERFNKSAITNSIIQQLSRGSDPICLIDTLCDMIDEQTLLMERLIINQGVPSILIKKEKCTCSSVVNISNLSYLLLEWIIFVANVCIYNK